MIKKIILLSFVLTIFIGSLKAQILVSGGSNGNYTIANYPGNFTGYYDGFSVTFKANHSIPVLLPAITASMSVAGLAAKNIISTSGSNLVENDIRQNQIVTLVFDATNNRFQMITTSGNAPHTFEASTVKGTLSPTAAKSATDILISPLFIPAPIAVNEIRIYITTAEIADGQAGVYDANGFLMIAADFTMSQPEGVVQISTGITTILPSGQYYTAVTWGSFSGVIAGADISPTGASGAIARTGRIMGMGGMSLPGFINLNTIVAGEFIYAVSLNE